MNNNKQKTKFLLYFFSLLTLLLLLIPNVLAEDTQKAATGDKKAKSIIGIDCDEPSESWYGRVYCIWLGGLTAKEFNLSGEIIKWLFLILIILLIYSTLAFTNFPPNAVVRILISIISGALATFLIATEEFLTIIQSYSAMGIALSVFLPIFILGFFTLVVATKVNPIGILLQRIIWLVFSLYLFLKSAIFYAISSNCKNIPKTINAGDIANIIQNNCEGSSLVSLSRAIVGDQALANYFNHMSKFDTTILLLLIITSVAVFLIAVVSNKLVIHWLAHEKVMAPKKALEQRTKRTEEYEKVKSAAMERATGGG
ncbi:MAG: hypothetical protein N3D20_02480 [Candidatus Pacearchaeota archaeon]|nr:hypothetical protein [Candidatus Pacearchaeota archaeon]